MYVACGPAPTGIPTEPAGTAEPAAPEAPFFPAPPPEWDPEDEHPASTRQDSTTSGTARRNERMTTPNDRNRPSRYCPTEAAEPHQGPGAQERYALRASIES
ncbi:hypothetical protein GCM10010276_88130 [Streptomyces longisporus]|uniref:Uncharacterized protein n=1 Tax=Streptomyces longisporus TaxID=1948 RepID=A0ABP6ATP0_STRLO